MGGIDTVTVNKSLITYLSRDLTPPRMLPLHKNHVLDIEQGSQMKADHKPAMPLTQRIAQWVRYV